MSDWEIEEEDAPSTSTEAYSFQVEAGQAGQRLDVYVASLLPDATRSTAQRLLDLPADSTEGVWVNGKREKASLKVRNGDTIEVVRPSAKPIEVTPENIPLDIVFEDSEMLVINKARGMVVHPAPGAECGTLVNAVLYHAKDLSGVGGALRPGIVHRLDKDTSGLIMVAKTDLAHRALQAQIQSRVAERRYLALIWGVPKFQHAKVDAPLGRHPSDRKKMAVVTDSRYTSRPSQTELFIKETFAGVFSFAEAKLHTGRTHQIRVHTAYIQHPVVGDPLYGGIRKVASNAFTNPERVQIEQAVEALEGQALHAYSLAFNHPTSGERLHFNAPLPPVFQNLMDTLYRILGKESDI